MRLDSGYREYAPPPQLRGAIACFWTRIASSDREQVRVLPDACSDLIWGGGAGAWVAGPDTSAWLSTPVPGRVLVGARFRPGAGGAALAHPLSDLLQHARAARRADARTSTRGSGRSSIPTRRCAAWPTVPLASRSPGPPDPAVQQAVRLLADPRRTGGGAARGARPERAPAAPALPCGGAATGRRRCSACFAFAASSPAQSPAPTSRAWRSTPAYAAGAPHAGSVRLARATPARLTAAGLSKPAWRAAVTPLPHRTVRSFDLHDADEGGVECQSTSKHQSAGRYEVSQDSPGSTPGPECSPPPTCPSTCAPPTARRARSEAWSPGGASASLALVDCASLPFLGHWGAP